MTFAKYPWRAPWRAVVLSAAMLLPSACAFLEPPGNPFVGVWNTPERQQIAFRDAVRSMIEFAKTRLAGVRE